ncbi:MAG: polysaccharide deacetylase family protein [Thermoleophilum sp.]|nr:polysaccharide deacetylase family protein [Thermoleophilum sp.]
MPLFDRFRRASARSLSPQPRTLALVAVAALCALATPGCGGGNGASRERFGRTRHAGRHAVFAGHHRHRPHIRSSRHRGGATAPSPARVPLLGFHEVRDPPPSARYPALYLDPAKFAMIIDWLRRHGFRAVTLARLVAAWRGRAQLPARPIVLTFDDGYASVYRNAFPLLGRLRWPAVVNLEVAALHSPDGLRPRQVRRLVAAGWEIASHTLTHPDLTRTGTAQLERELRGSRRAIARLFGVRATDFCYPAGRFDRRVERAVARAGYQAAETELPGVATRRSDPLALRRIMVARDEPLPSLFALLSHAAGRRAHRARRA